MIVQHLSSKNSIFFSTTYFERADVQVLLKGYQQSVLCDQIISLLCFPNFKEMWDKIFQGTYICVCLSNESRKNVFAAKKSKFYTFQISRVDHEVFTLLHSIFRRDDAQQGSLGLRVRVTTNPLRTKQNLKKTQFPFYFVPLKLTT